MMFKIKVINDRGGLIYSFSDEKSFIGLSLDVKNFKSIF